MPFYEFEHEGLTDKEIVKKSYVIWRKNWLKNPVFFGKQPEKYLEENLNIDGTVTDSEIKRNLKNVNS